MPLAQLNVALPVGPLDGPALAGFMENLVAVNARADAAPGFVWRLQTEDGDATAAEARKRPAAHPEVIATSSEGGMGIAELRAAVVEAAST